MEIKNFVAEERCARADIWLAERLENKTRSAVKKLFDGEYVLINGKAAKPSQPMPSKTDHFFL